ncbi:hypothetical protein BCON_0026g00180 [Botryotinia convoluta]|uniref:Uncharacterized protein n=1 Tax=Botryotinia convoluta TaxID=54673 RepID=A0A4Z1ILZ1_9HELO|nr:hypothetical protein BCON_0026g00180 [Botryotinia convoluta]
MYRTDVGFSGSDCFCLQALIDESEFHYIYKKIQNKILSRTIGQHYNNPCDKIRLSRITTKTAKTAKTTTLRAFDKSSSVIEFIRIPVRPFRSFAYNT